MQGKFGRNYRLDIFTPQGKQITIAPPFSIQFSINRNTLASANKGSMTLYNLAPNTRNQIYKDRFSITEYWRISLNAGYGDRLHNVFTGNIFEAYSYKQGTEWITSLDCFDGMDAIQNGFTSMTVEADTPKENILSNIVNDMPNVIKGLFGSIAEGEAPRGKSLMGQSSAVLSQETDDKYFIDNEIVNILNDSEVLPGAVISLDPDDLLGTPRRREAFLDLPTLFEPQVKIGKVYNIESLEARYNGQYKIMGFTHNVTISSAAAGQATTNLSLYFGADGLQEVS